MEGCGWIGCKYNGIKKTGWQWSENVGNGGRLYWKSRPTVDWGTWEQE
jgi:hypothetical protein